MIVWAPCRPGTSRRNIGIQHYKQDNSLNDEEVAMIAAWADNGTPEGDPADLPPVRVFEAGRPVDHPARSRRDLRGDVGARRRRRLVG